MSLAVADNVPHRPPSVSLYQPSLYKQRTTLSPLSMARPLSRTPILRPQTLTLIRLPPSRAKSNRADNATSIEIDLGSRSEAGGEVEVHLEAKRIEDAIHTIYAQRSAPDWLPFVPGSSYWVPPKSKSTAAAAAGVVRMIRSTVMGALTEEEAISFETVRGWPSSAYFVEGNPEKRTSKKPAGESDDED